MSPASPQPRQLPSPKPRKPRQPKRHNLAADQSACVVRGRQHLPGNTIITDCGQIFDVPERPKRIARGPRELTCQSCLIKRQNRARALRLRPPTLTPAIAWFDSAGRVQRRRAIDPDRDFVGITEIAELLGVSRSRGYAIIDRDDFPPPIICVKGMVLWLREQVEAYLPMHTVRADKYRSGPGYSRH